MKGALFHAIPFFNCPKFYDRHIESCSTAMTRRFSADVLSYSYV
jgi:hypothetical protein